MPVPDLAKMSLPSKARGIALACTAVGIAHFCSFIPRNRRGSSPNDEKVTSVFEDSSGCFFGVADGDDGSEASGTSCSFSFRLDIVRVFFVFCDRSVRYLNALCGGEM